MLSPIGSLQRTTAEKSLIHYSKTLYNDTLYNDSLYFIYILIFIVISILAVIVFKGLSLKKFSKVTLCLSKNRQSLLHEILYNDTFSSDTYNLEISIILGKVSL